MLDVEPWFNVKIMLTIGKVAKRAGLKASAIRYYERHGLLRPSRLPNGYRFYDQDAVKALLFLRNAQALGMTLKDIRQTLDLVREGQRPCSRVRELARQHLTEIDARIRQLRFLRAELRSLLARRVLPGDDGLCPLIPSNLK
jgi:DNA-binding transcriptional MerR regulator